MPASLLPMATSRKVPGSQKAAHKSALLELRKFGLAFPEAHTKSPWPGHMDLAVKDKTFTYLNVDGEPLSISCKLPESAVEALALPFTRPTEYGLGKSGWVSADFPWEEAPPVALLKLWIEESYRAQAPKRLVALLSPGTNKDSQPPRKKAKSARSKTALTKTAGPKTARSKPVPSKPAR